MRTSRFKAEEVVRLLDEVASGAPVREICIRAGVSETTLYMWRARYSGLGPRGIDRLRQLERENSALRTVLDVKDLEIDVLKAELQHTEGRMDTEDSNP